MKIVVLNGIRVSSTKDLHRILQQKMAFPDYYGKNLDALYDQLSTERRPTLILFFGARKWKEQMGLDGEAVIRVFEDASAINPILRLLSVERSPFKGKLLANKGYAGKLIHR